MSWDRMQREVLDALGHTVYRVAPANMPPIPDDPLLHALLRAAGRSADADDAGLLYRTWPIAGLRDNPTAKRALWPRLRALRPTTGFHAST